MQSLPALVIAYPHIDPVIFEIGPFAVRWYAVSYIAGIMLAWWYAVRLVKKDSLWAAWDAAPATPAQIDDFIMWATLGIILGGRLGYIFFYGLIYEPARYSDIFNWLKIWEGGMSFHGGLIGVILAVIGFSRTKGIDMIRFGDIVASVAPIGLLTGRIANFINGELWGKRTDVPWAMVFPNAPDAAPRHPSQLYEAALEGILLFLILRFIGNRLRGFDRPGLIIAAFLFCYGLFRIIAELFRDSDQLVLGGIFSMGQLLSAIMFVGAAFFYGWSRSHGPKAG